MRFTQNRKEMIIQKVWIFIFLAGIHVVEGKVLTKNGSCGNIGEFININENEEIGSILYNISIKAGDKFSIDDDSDGYLNATREGDFGIISLKKSFDYEKVKIYTFTMTCKTPNNAIRILVQNVIEGNITFARQVYNASVKEDASNGMVIIPRVEIDLADLGPNDHNNIQVHADAKEFYLQFVTASIYELQLKEHLNYSVQHQYKFTATAYLPNYPDKNATAEFIINVTDVDNLNPKFTNSSYDIDIKENPIKIPDTTKLRLKAIDQDTDIDAEINYELIKEIPNKNWFSVNSSTGYLNVIGKLDREECSQLTLFVKGYQVNNKELRYDVTWVTITILDEDDNEPEMDKLLYNVSVPENLSVDTYIVQLKATDKDEGDNAKFLYHFSSTKSDTICNGLKLDQSTGMITVANSAVLDREKNSTLTCQVFAQGINRTSNDSTVIVNLIDENDNNPTFSDPIYNYTIKKNITVGHRVGQVTAVDKDLNPDITYRITDKSFSIFHIDKKSGWITLNTSLTENFLKLYNFEVVASDGDKKTSRHTSVTVNINVLDVNIHKPELSPVEYNITVLEDVAIGTHIVYVKAKDKDPDDTLTFSLAGTSSSYFEINKTSGIVSLKNALDYEVLKSHKIVVKVSDSVHTATTTVSVTVEDVNDNAPKFNKTSYLFTNITEEKTNIAIGTVHATDADSGENRKFTYSIETPWLANFSISKTGKITVVGELDRESIDDEQGQIKFIVMAIDHGDLPLTGTTEVTVKVTDANDNCPYFNTQDQNFTYVFKELARPHNFHKIEAQDMDKDSKNRQMNYTFMGQSAGFGINQTSGYLSATDKLTMENSTNGQISLEIVVSNKPDCIKNETAKQTIIIILQDVNRYPPQFNKTSYSFTLKEDVTVGSELQDTRITATDRDASAKYNTVTYWIGKGNDAGDFYMDHKTAQIYLHKPLDYEKKTQYILTVHATDGHLYNSSTTNTTVKVTINVENVNDNTPKFDKAFYRCTVPENVNGVISGCEIKVTDHDTGSNGNLKLSVQNEDNFRMQNISDVWKVDVVKSLDYDNGQRLFHLEILAKDEGIPSLNSSAIVEVTVTNVNDNEPYFINLPYNFTIPEDVEKPSLIGRIMAEDIDGDNLTYSITSSDFTVRDNGNLYTDAGFVDRHGPVTFRVKVTDSNHTKLSNVTVHISDVNNNPPVFIHSTYHLSVTENEKDREIGNINATDKDEGVNKEIIYSLFTSEWTHSFTIDMKSGTISLNGSVDRELLDNTDGQITMIVMATDKGTPPLTGTAEVIIEVKDVNDNCPYFTEEDQNFMYIWKELSEPLNFHKAVAYDKDSTDINKQIIYKLTEGKPYFTVHSNGSLSAKGGLKMETTQDGRFDIVIEAYNIGSCGGSGQPTYLQNVTVVLQDVNDHTPVFNPIRYHFSVKENVAEGNKINNVSIVAKDKDPTAQYNTVHYNIHSGNDGNHFHMDQFTGNLFLIKQLDYETDKKYTLQITATDGQPSYSTNSIKTVTSTVEITVLDVNDNTPQFDKTFYRCTVPENVKGAISGCEIKVTDHDTGSNGNLKLSVQNEDRFRMQNISDVWKVDVVKSLDYDKGQRLFHLEILAEDEGIPSLNSSAIVEVTVTNVNDNEPYFINLPYNFTIPEDIEKPSLIGRIMAEDIDGDNLTYSITSSDFTVRDNGNLYTNDGFVDRHGPVTFRVKVTDSNHTKLSNVTVHISDVNNNPPVFIHSTYHLSVTENEKDREIGNINATDKDEGVNKEIIYSLFTSEWTHSFTIDMKSGTISLNGSVDRELLDNTDGQITMIVMATDKGTPPLTGTAEVIIEVKDVNDNCPYFTEEDQNFMYIWKELSEPLNFHKAVAYDKDSTDINKQIIYKLTEGKPYFTVHSNGSLSAKGGLKMETTQDGRFDIVIEAYNIGSCGGSGQPTYLQNVTVVLQDVNDHTPVFNPIRYHFSVKENVAEGNKINNVSIVAKDKDPTAQYNTVHYSIHSGNDGNHFHMNQFTGNLFLIKQLDYETDKNYTLQITATDGQPSYSTNSIKTVTAMVEITVLDVNDNTPQFDKTFYRCTVPENVKGAISGCEIKVTDHDTGSNGNLKLSVQNEDKFRMQNKSDVWKVDVVKSLDYDKGQRLFHLEILAEDEGIPSLHSSAIVEVTVTNVNDNEPYFINLPYTFTIPEDVEKPSLIGRIMAEDIDGDNLTYSITSSDFTIGDNGNLYTNTDFVDRRGPFIFEVNVTDSTYTNLSDITVHISDVNNNPPVFINSTYHFSVTENETDKEIGDVSAADKDEGVNKEIIYSLFTSEWTHSFIIDMKSGAISLNGSVDRERLDNTNGQITMIVMATDKGTPPLTGTAEVVIEVKDVNDNCPYFNEEDQNFMYIWKELSKPHNFHKAVAYDKDSTDRNNKITYKLTEGKSYFTIDPDGSLSASEVLEMEKTQDGKFDIIIEAYNMGPCGGSGQSTHLQNVTVVLQDVNNNKPEMTEKNFTFRVFENLPTGSSINSAKRISATDKDTSTEYNTVTYWMLGGNTNNTFHVDHYSGDIYLVKQLDYDEGPKSYKLLILAIDCLNTTDGHCNHNDTAVVNIDVIDINDNPPRFTPDVYHCTTNENQTGPINNCKVTAVDKDSGRNGNLTYHSLNGTLDVSSSGNINVNTELDYESDVSEYSIIIQAIDNGNPKLTGTATVILTVLDINDNTPVFVGAPYHFNLTENEPIRTIIGLISATDMDSKSSLTFSLCNHTSEFSIDNKGLLFSDKEFDFDNGTKVYYIEVDVSDGINSDQTTVVVTIININDNQPVFAKHTFYTKVKEDITLTSMKVFASDIDKLGPLSYSIVGGGGNCSDIFRMDNKTGKLFINNTEDCLDHDISPVHTLLIEARDGNPFSHVSNALVQINILDIDNKPPRFSWSKYTSSVNENAPIGTTIIKVKAFDNDTPDDKLTYKVTNCTDEFDFSDNIFMTKKILDAETQTNYTVNISVTDGTRYDYAIIYVTIEDVNDNLPTFSPEVKNFSIPANAIGNRSVGKISAKDEDISNDGFTFYLLKGDHFWIENKTGELYVMDGLGNHQFEANKTYKVVVNVVDHGQPPLTNSEEIDIFIDITNHFPPKFDQINSTKSIPENATIDTVITIVTATDKDPDSAGVVWYKLKPDVLYDGKFDIDKNTGEITLKSSLDFEELGHYELTVLGIDKADDPKTGTTHVQIIVTDVNEKPLFLEKMDGMCIKSPISKDQLVAVVSAKDPDKIDNLTYSLTDTKYFRIGDKNGEITANRNLNQSNFRLIVIVKDKGELTDRKEIDLYNNPSLVITPAIITVSITENSTDHLITKVNATSNNSLTYSLFNTTGFSIDRDGTIRSNNALDRETDAQQVVYVMVNSSSSSCQAQVNIKVIDVNDNPPRFAFLYDTPTVAEDYPTGKCFFYLPVEDPDQDTHLTLRIIDDNSGGKFTIQSYRNQTGGCLMLNNSLDFDEMKENFHGVYNLTAEVYDGIYYSTREIKVHVTDINDNSPYFSEKQYYASISENVPTFTSIIHMTAHDKDAIDKGRLTYSLEGDDSVYFIIENTTHYGDLLVNTSLDREQNSSYTVTVVAHDSDGHNGSTIVNITVLDVNDNEPSFINKSYVFTHLEGVSSVGFEMAVSTVDPDLGDNGTDFFTLPDTFGGLFNITTHPNNRGLITVMTALDRESPNVRTENGMAVFTLHVGAVDKGNPPRSSTAMVTLNVEDINDCVPQFGKSHYNATVLEGSPKGFSILTVTASDCDYKSAYNDISLSLTGTDADLFEIDNDGLIKLATTISVQSHKNMFDLTIVANDSLNINNASLSVIISDVNDHDPVFAYTVYNFTTPETDGIIDPNIVVGVVNATDEDLGNNGVITYSIISIDVKRLFNISQNGTITVIGSLDRDKCISSRYPFTVIARDNGSSRRTGYTEVIVYLTDINDNAPVFTQNSYNGKIQENSPVDKEVIILPPIYATDDDYGINGTIGIRYSLVDSDLSFMINEISGRVFVNSSNLDREAQPFYSLQVTAADRNGTGREQTVNLTVTLLDVNDVPPEFSTKNYTFYVNESAPAGQEVGTVMTTDDDVNGNITTRYRIASGSDGKFYVDILSGVIYTSGGLDREKKSEYLITLEAFDGQQKTDAQVYVYLEDVNDNCPVFPQHNLVVRVPENTQNSTIVYNLTASDADEGQNGDITFYIISSETSLFVVYGDRLILNGVLDREKQSHYQFQVFVKDNGNPPCHVSSTMEILVEDVNDNPPVFYNAEDKVISTSTATILEKSPVGSPILLPNVADIDIDENAVIIFSLQADKRDILNYFKINSKTGVVTIAEQVDLNSLNRLHILEKNATKTASLEMFVVATDSGVPPLSSNLTLTVVVEGINDQAPVFLLPEYNLTISENIHIGAYVGNVEAVVENGTTYKLQYSLISNSNSEKYFIVAPISGNITTKTKIDREKTPTFSFAVQVKDGKIPERTAYTVVSVTVRDINDNCPEFKQKSYEYIVEENIPPQPLSILATDADEGQNGIVVYTLMDNEGGHFLLGEQTGMLSVNGSLNREEEAFYNLTVEAHDNGSPSCINSVNVMVIVTDQNDNKPEFSIPKTSCKVKENERPGTHVCDVAAYDPDNGLNSTVVYMFTGTSSQQFEIDPLGGSISTLVTLDYEEQSVYNLTIMAMDLGTPVLNSTTVIHIMVQDLYDTAPKFTKRIYDRTIDIDTQLSTIILSVNAGQYVANYAIEDGNHGNHFDIDSSSGDITLVSRLGTSVHEYQLNVSATDGVDTDYAKVLFHVATSTIQKKDNTYTTKIQENVNTTVLLIDLNYTDGSNAVFHYELTHIIPDVKNTFELNQTTGQLYCVKKLDRENIDQYIFYVKAVTSSNRRKRSFGDSQGEIVIVVNVQDENDNPPLFNGGQQVMTIGISDTTNTGDLITTLKAEDADISSTIKYSITGGNDKDSFDIDTTTGKVYSQIKVNSEKSYNIIVKATDGKQDSEIKILFLVMSSFDKLVLTIPITSSEFERKQTTLLRNISAIVGFKIEMEKYDVHVDSNKKTVDLSSTDIYFHGINESTGSIVPQQTAFRIIYDKKKEIASLFDEDKVTVITYHTPLSPHKMSESEIALLTIGVIIFLSCLLAIIAAKYTWNQFETVQRNLQDKIWELNSFHSSHTNGTIRQTDIGAINPTYQETQFNTTEDQVAATNMRENVTAPSRREYESQEVILDLPLEPLEAELHPPVEGGVREMSLGYDSGLENESNSTTSANENGQETRPGNSAIRIETSVLKDDEKDDNSSSQSDKEQEAGPSRRQEVFIFEMETGDTDDNEIEEEGGDERIKRRKSSKKKRNSDLKVFSIHNETGDIDSKNSIKRTSKDKKTSETKLQEDQESGELPKATVEEQTQVISATSENVTESNITDTETNSNVETVPNNGESCFMLGDNMAENDDDDYIKMTSF